MQARVMISSVVQDKVKLGPTDKLEKIGYSVDNLTRDVEKPITAESIVQFSAIREELKRHLEERYGFEVFIFEETPGSGRPPEEETMLEVQKSHLVIGILGSTLGWKVPDADPLTPTLREWRTALRTPMKFRAFWSKDGIDPNEITGELGNVLREMQNYKKGKTNIKFSGAADLLVKVESSVQSYIQEAVASYVADRVNRERNEETQEWLLSSYKERVKKMQKALKKIEIFRDPKNWICKLDGHAQPVLLHAIPDSFSVAESRKFVAYIFEDELKRRKLGTAGQLHIVAAFGSVTDAQIRHHLGNFESAEVFKGAWGFFGSDPGSGMQALYLPYCDSTLVMQEKAHLALDWIRENQEQIIALSLRRKQILDVIEQSSALATPKPPGKVAANVVPLRKASASGR